MSKAENREVKSDAFSMLMENKVYALEVYNALNGTSYTDPELVEIVTLKFLQLRGDEVIKNMVLDYTFERRIELTKNEYMEKGMQQGMQQGMKKLLINLIMKKINEQKSLEETVLDLGEEQSVVEPFYYLIQDNPGKTVDELLEIYNSK